MQSEARRREHLLDVQHPTEKLGRVWAWIAQGRHNADDGLDGPSRADPSDAVLDVQKKIREKKVWKLALALDRKITTLSYILCVFAVVSILFAVGGLELAWDGEAYLIGNILT